ncbi:hypothetical protein AVEN_55039-1 [Araneus ventricosus]|uniref:Uncharacterized protein n=1 Tax=Araneus ventricosus TaxID=182803 RepID=A0A4Y2IER5_ARAVE|nr:hypothetical protein AVEN_55039-1 [Araneus ventricosus]
MVVKLFFTLALYAGLPYVYTGLPPDFTPQSRILPKASEWEELERTIAFLLVRNIGSGKSENPFNQFVYLKDYLEKDNAKQNCEATMKLRMEEKWLKSFADTKYIDQKSCLIKLRMGRSRRKLGPFCCPFTKFHFMKTASSQNSTS